MKIIFLLSVLLTQVFLASCSSGPTNSSDGKGRHGSKGKDDSTEGSEDSDTAKPAIDYHPKLVEAVRAKNNELIPKLASLALQQNANDVTALEAYGLYHFRKNQFEAAQYFFKRALPLAPNSSSLYNSLGLVALAEKKSKDALGFFMKAVELDKKNTAAAMNASSILLEGRNYAKAQFALSSVSPSDDPKFLTNLAISEMGSGHYDEAKSHFKAALKANGQSKEALFNYVILLADYLKEPKEASDTLSRLRFLGLNVEMKERLSELESKIAALEKKSDK